MRKVKELSEKQKRLAEGKAQGMTDLEACKKAGYSAKSSSAANNQVRRMMENDGFSSYLAKISEEARSSAVATKREVMEFLTAVMNTPIGEVTPLSRLAQEHQAGTENSGEKIKMPSKLDAIDKLARLNDWYAAEKVDHKITSVKDLILKARRNG